MERPVRMYTDSYQFGQIVIDGKTYDSDCLLYADTVHPNWWRRQGHSLFIEDLETVVSAKPNVLVIGCGVRSMMHVTQLTRQLLQKRGIGIEVLDTQRAVDRFNKLTQAGVKTAAALHITF